MAKAQIDWPAVELLFFSSDLTLRELAAKVGISYGTIAARAARHKWQDKKDALKRGELPIALRPPKAPDSEGETQSGEDVNTGIPGEETQSRAIAPSKGGLKRITAANMAANAQTVIAREAESYRKRMANQAKRLPDIMETLDDKALLAQADRLEKLDKLNRRTLELDTPKQQAPLIQIDLLATLDADPLLTAKTVHELSTSTEEKREETASQPATLDDADDEAD